jgi:hypothetical protein
MHASYTHAGIEDLRKSTTQMRSETDTLKTAAARGSNRLLAQYTTPAVTTTTATARAVSARRLFCLLLTCVLYYRNEFYTVCYISDVNSMRGHTFARVRTRCVWCLS